MAETIALSHHERWDGRGYPHGLSGEDIPIAARIAHVADVFDAMQNPRPRGRSVSFAHALDFIRDEAGAAFDPAVAHAFLSIARQPS